MHPEQTAWSRFWKEELGSDCGHYYRTGQWKEVSNRFMAMPSARTRILGVQLYLYKISGFLHWGFNFYNSQYSIKHINPYAVTDAGEAFPSGDAFLVYPGEGGVPEESIRLMLMQQVMQDVRAFELLESLVGRERSLVKSSQKERMNRSPSSAIPKKKNGC